MFWVTGGLYDSMFHGQSQHEEWLLSSSWLQGSVERLGGGFVLLELGHCVH